jgi:hypothetical protein
MYRLTCEEKVQAIYTTMAQEDDTMTYLRALRAHFVLCPLGENCSAGERRDSIEEVL